MNIFKEGRRKMPKKEFFVLILFIVDMFVAFAICSYFNISNVVLLKSYTAMNMDITYEVLIWFGLAIIQAIFIDRKEIFANSIYED